MMILKAVAHVLSPGGRSGRLSILIFHRVLAQPDALFPGEQDARRFDEVLSWVGRWFQVMPLDEAARRLASGGLPPRTAVITFDDGYADNAEIALPILLRHRMTATFFIATSFLDGGRMWNDTVIESVRSFDGAVLDLREAGLGSHAVDSIERRRVAVGSLLGQIKYMEPLRRREAVAFVQAQSVNALPVNLMMSSQQVVQLRDAGMQIGAHTCTHPILARLPDAEARAEIRGSKTSLEALLGERIELFAYPNGKPGKDYMPVHAQMVREEGFSAAVSTAPGVAVTDTDRFQLPRFSPWDASRSRYGLRMMSNLRNSRPVTV